MALSSSLSGSNPSSSPRYLLLRPPSAPLSASASHIAHDAPTVTTTPHPMSHPQVQVQVRPNPAHPRSQPLPQPANHPSTPLVRAGPAQPPRWQPHPPVHTDTLRKLYRVVSRSRMFPTLFSALVGSSTDTVLCVQPFLPDDSPVHSWIPDRRWTITLPSLVLIAGLASVGVYAGLLLREDALRELEGKARVQQR